jgi:xylan 1,4-beta-xylosidase
MTSFHRALFLGLVLLSLGATGQQIPAKVTIEVNANQNLGAWKPIWNYFGYDEPNYTYAANGKKLLGELAAASATPVYVRTHNLFTTGDGTGSLKWGSTNVYTEDASGKPVYDWRVVDQIFDTYHALGIKPLVELGFMPQALSTHPEPYRHNFPNGSIFTGWAYPPKDYQKWSELVFQFVKHLRDRYGEAETRTWLWEVWNEPDIDYWKGTQEEFFKLYDFSVAAILRALPGARVGGPDTTGPGSDRSIAFLKAFLNHCAHQNNFVTGKKGSPLDFVSFHPKGRPTLQDGHVRMGSRTHLSIIQRGFEIVASFPEWKNTPIILGESDPEGCAACSAQQHPENAYRNGTLYAAYTVAILNQIYVLEARTSVKFQGAVTWAFEFEDQPPFAGFRELATNGLDKPVLNAFRMFGILGGQRVAAISSGAVPLDEMLQSGVTGHSDINAIATRKDREIDVLVWNYHDDEVPGTDVPLNLMISGVPTTANRVLLEQFLIDETHSNSYAEWKRIGSPQQPTAQQYQQLESAGHLQQSGSPRWVESKTGVILLNFSLPGQSVSLIRITW